jgi:formylglycine-generating enzyme required for sulfatase activity
VIGSTTEEAEAAGRAYEQFYLQRGDQETAKRARQWPTNEINRSALTLAPFAIGRYPVTNAQYQQFMEVGGYDPQADWWDEPARTWLARDDAATEGLEQWQRRERKDQPEFWDDETFGHARRNYPVVGISWYEASAFCCWLTQHLHDGYDYLLPSEAEWEYAARGADRRVYAWGSAPKPDDERANYGRTFDGTTAVGCFPRGATPEGILDVAGSVWEWTRSTFRPYPYDPADGREDGADPAQKRFTLRGGSWNVLSIHLRAADRYHLSPHNRYHFVGFRLARRPPRVKK